ncbi:UNVERIFIED_CONTAM: Aldehyde oxidase GLOX [Sesamum latifolium]|uniref:Aldehyde oxidase GLOX n=1 Tax=Sesamum latifolium TaxID=2727402 RepID=A0AAW2WC68_9LAMI
MHMQLLNTDRVIVFRPYRFWTLQYFLPNNQCRNDPNDLTLKVDCTAHSVEYDVAPNSIRPLNVLTDVWCSSGSVMLDGSLMQTGGFNDGDRNGVVVRNYPTIPGGDPRSYPSSGSAVLLPLRDLQGGTNVTAEVLVCGGALKGSFTSANNKNFVGTLNTCGRIRISDPNPQWVMETMPLARVMGDMVLLPNGNILILNGASSGTAGWDLSRNPVLTPLIYRPNNPIGLRFEAQNSSSNSSNVPLNGNLVA